MFFISLKINKLNRLSKFRVYQVSCVFTFVCLILVLPVFGASIECFYFYNKSLTAYLLIVHMYVLSFPHCILQECRTKKYKINHEIFFIIHSGKQESVMTFILIHSDATKRFRCAAVLSKLYADYIMWKEATPCYMSVRRNNEWKCKHKRDKREEK